MDLERLAQTPEQKPQTGPDKPLDNSHSVLEALRATKLGYILAAMSVKLAMLGGADSAEATNKVVGDNVSPQPIENTNTAKTSALATASKIYIRGSKRFGISGAIEAPKFEKAPGLNSPGLSSIDRKCVQSGLRSPSIKEAALYYPGGRPGPTFQPQQLIRVSALFPAMPLEECSDNYRRINQIKTQMQDPKNHKIWHDMRGEGIWLPVSCISCRGKEDLNKAGEYYFQDDPTGHELESYYYRCTRGSGITHVRAFLRQRVKKLSDNQVLGQKIIKVPIAPFDSLQNPKSVAC